MTCPCCNLRPVKSKKWGLCHACNERRRRNGVLTPPRPKVDKEAQKRAFQADLSDPRHGSVNGYTNLGCRCKGPGSCTEAWRLDHFDYMHAKPERLESHRIREAQYRAAKKKAS
jgi:hypothetical protein